MDANARRRLRLAIIGALALVALVALTGCEDDARGPRAPTGASRFAGHLDPSTGEFVLQRVEVTGHDGRRLPVDLIGSNLEFDPERGSIRLDVALRNAGLRTLYPPAVVWVRNFDPRSVRLVNANLPSPTGEDGAWAIDYAHLLGPDGMLLAGRSSHPYRWHLMDPDGVAFSFGAEVIMRYEPPAAEISGGVYEDLNQNGIRERNEPPWRGGFLELTAPDGTKRQAFCEENGAFRFYVEDLGLYRIELISMVDCIVCFTTPNPIEIVLPPGPDDLPQSYRGAVFGAVCGECLD